MSNVMAYGGLTATNVSADRGLAEPWNRLAGTAPAPRMGAGAAKATLSKAQAGSPGKTKPQHSDEQIKAYATRYIGECWKQYAKAFPEAFSNPGNRAKATAPTLVFGSTQAEFDKLIGHSVDTADMIAFVKTDDPSRVFVNLNKLTKYANQFGLDYVKANIGHELIHNLTNASNVRIVNDLEGKSASYPEVRRDLNSLFFFNDTKTPGIKRTASVAQLIQEFAAEHYSAKVTGIASFGVAYAPIRAEGAKLLQRVGDAVFRKAVFANDPVAYRQVVKAAVALQKENAQTKILNERAQRITEMRAAQTAVPFGTRHTPATAEKMEARYFREFSLYSHLKETAPDQLAKFDFRFLHAVDANLASRGQSFDPDLSADGMRQLAVAIQTVWPRLR